MGSLHSAFLLPVIQTAPGFSCSLGTLSVLPGSGALFLVEIIPLFFPSSSEVSVIAECLC